jgi:hypothetical protein
MDRAPPVPPPRNSNSGIDRNKVDIRNEIDYSAPFSESPTVIAGVHSHSVDGFPDRERILSAQSNIKGNPLPADSGTSRPGWVTFGSPSPAVSTLVPPNPFLAGEEARNVKSGV